MGIRNITASLLGIAAFGLAQPAAAAGYGYVEVSAGISFFDDIDGNVTVPGFAGSIPVSVSVNDGANVGFEFGAGNILGTGLRAGAAFTWIDFEIESATALGFTIPASAIGGGSSGTVEVVEGRLYYDIPLQGIVTPYVGVGLGAVNYTEEGQFLWSLIGGAQVDLTENMYLGARYTYSNTDIDDGPNVTIDPINIHSISGQIGFRIGNTGDTP